MVGTIETTPILDMNVGRLGIAPAPSTIEVFRTYDPATRDVVFWGERRNINALVSEAKRIRLLATREMTKPHAQKSAATAP